MKRELHISNPLWGDETLSIVEVDNFLHRVDGVVWSMTLVNGVGSVELPALRIGSQNFYMIVEKKQIFTLWDNETEPMVLDDFYFRKIFPVMNGDSTTDEIDILNFNCVLDSYLRGEPVISAENERMLCDYFSFAGGNENKDIRLCNIDKGLTL